MHVSKHSISAPFDDHRQEHKSSCIIHSWCYYLLQCMHIFFAIPRGCHLSHSVCYWAKKWWLYPICTSFWITFASRQLLELPGSIQHCQHWDAHPQRLVVPIIDGIRNEIVTSLQGDNCCAGRHVGLRHEGSNISMALTRHRVIFVHDTQVIHLLFSRGCHSAYHSKGASRFGQLIPEATTVNLLYRVHSNRRRIGDGTCQMFFFWRSHWEMMRWSMLSIWADSRTRLCFPFEDYRVRVWLTIRSRCWVVHDGGKQLQGDRRQSIFVCRWDWHVIRP